MCVPAASRPPPVAEGDPGPAPHLGRDAGHMLRNETSAPAETIAVQLLPNGTDRRIHAPAPGNLPVLTASRRPQPSTRGSFVDTHRTTGEHGGWLRLAGAPPQIRKLFGLVALDRLLDFRDNTDAALADV